MLELTLWRSIDPAFLAASVSRLQLFVPGGLNQPGGRSLGFFPSHPRLSRNSSQCPAAAFGPADVPVSFIRAALRMDDPLICSSGLDERLHARCLTAHWIAGSIDSG